VADGIDASTTAPDRIGTGDDVRAVSVKGATLLRRRPHEAQDGTIRPRCITRPRGDSSADLDTSREVKDPYEGSAKLAGPGQEAR
jgi:hypothetical protein